VAGGYLSRSREATASESYRAAREEEVLMIDFASPNQAMAKVMVRIHQNIVVDYLNLSPNRWRLEKNLESISR